MTMFSFTGSLFLPRSREIRFSAARPLFTVALLGFLLCAAPIRARAQAGEEITLREGLVISGVTRGGGRRPFTADAVQAQMVRGAWQPPKAGDTVRLPDGAERVWEAIRADEQGVFTSRSLTGGGYLYANVDSPQERIALLEARGHSGVYVNGELRPGDPYDYGYLRLPVKLRRGANHLLFVAGRGRLRVRLIPVSSSPTLLLNTDDPTLPDVLLGEDRPLRGGVIVINASERPVTDAVLTAAVRGKDGNGATGHRRETKVPAIPPLTVRKVAFEFAAPKEVATAPGEARLVLELKRRGATQTVNAELPLSIVRATDVHRRTFVSEIDDSVQYYAVNPAQKPSPQNALILSLHGASVEAIGQARAYGPKDWATLVAPTNRRPYGFDWEDWGRLDALEVLRIAQKAYPHAPRRVLLTGHSMGGHGTWSIGSLFPDRFAAIGPSAGWISFATYGGRSGAAETQATDVEALVARGATALSDTLLRGDNLLMVPVYILHGDADDNVPVEQARRMREFLTERRHANLQWHEEKGAGHWWDKAQDIPGADAVDFRPMISLLEASRIPSPAPAEVFFTTPDPSVSADCFYLRIEQQEKMLVPSSVRLTWDAASGTLRGETKNARRLAIRSGLLPGAGASALRRIAIDGQTLETPLPASSVRGTVYLVREAGRWRAADTPAPASEKNPERGGTFKQAFQNRFVLVYGTRGTPEENAWAYSRARLDAEAFLYRGNGAPEIIADRDYDRRKHRERNVLLYGHAEMNSLWDALLGGSPVQVKRGEVRVGGTTRKGEDMACLFLRPKPGTSRALVGAVCGTGMAGLRLTERLPVFVSGVVYPDWIIADSAVLEDTSRGVVGAGYFGNDWRIESGESAWREP